MIASTLPPRPSVVGQVVTLISRTVRGWLSALSASDIRESIRPRSTGRPGIVRDAALVNNIVNFGGGDRRFNAPVLIRRLALAA